MYSSRSSRERSTHNNHAEGRPPVAGGWPDTSSDKNMTKKILSLIVMVLASATLFGAGWWCSIHFADRRYRELPTRDATGNQSTKNEINQDQNITEARIPEYELLQKAKWVKDLPPTFRSVLCKGKINDLDSILYSEGMPEDLANNLVGEIALLSKYNFIHHGIGENRGRSFNAGIHNGKRMRYLIYPTHFMVFSVFDNSGPPTELTFGLALTGDGIKIVGTKYADMNSTGK